MIRIEVPKYCQNCLDFKADVTKPDRLYAGAEEVAVIGDTIIRCEYHRRCTSIKRYLEKQMEKGNNE